MSRVCVIIPMYGQEDYTNRCVYETTRNAGIEHDILVVDDGSEKVYKSRGVSITRLEKNSGFTAAVNAGIIWAQKRDYEYVLLLNNDTEPCPNFLKFLIDNMDSKTDIGINGSIRIHPTKKEERLAICGSDLIRGFQYFSGEDIPHEPFDCNIIPFASVLLRMDMVREIGLLDKRYRNHCSDTEYCIRAKVNKWRVVMVPDSKVIHHLSVTTTANNILVDDDQRLWIEKLACLDYAQVLSSMPLDGEANTWGKINFEVYQK